MRPVNKSGYIHGVADVRVSTIEGEVDPHTGKPYLIVAFGDVEVRMTTNLVLMIAAVAKGVQQRDDNKPN